MTRKKPAHTPMKPIHIFLICVAIGVLLFINTASWISFEKPAVSTIHFPLVGAQGPSAIPLASTAAPAAQTPVPTLPPQPTPSSVTPEASGLEQATAQVDTVQATPTLGPDGWMDLPVIPSISDTARQIYGRGLALGNNPNAFSKIGDCNSLSVRFLTYFDYAPSAYDLGAYTSLQPFIAQFKGSFMRQSQAVGDGFNTSAVLSPFRADLTYCEAGESPLACEYRLHKPSFALITIGTDDYLEAAKFEANLRAILDITIAKGIVPILTTKVDNANQLNYNPIIAALAMEYDIPLWNLWRAVQELPQTGQVDNIHPTGEFAAFYFTEDNLARYGWPVRNLTALQVLETAWSTLSQP